MELIADGLLIATAMTAGLYCLVLSRRLRKLTESGAGIGPQIEALDQALSETRAALTETREGVSELRSSAKAAIAQLARETARGEEVVERVRGGIDEAKATMQRLYEVRDRIEINEVQLYEAAPEITPEVEDEPDAEPDLDPSIDWAEKTEQPAGDSGAADSATGPKVALPEGEIIEEKSVSPAEPRAAPGNADARSGSVLKAERVML